MKNDDTSARRAEMLQNRLKKRERTLRKWAKRSGLEAYRVYDRDIPEIPLAIDRYNTHAYVALFQKSGDEERDAFKSEVFQKAIAEGLQIAFENVVFKTRAKQKGSAQYEKTDEKRERFIVQEQGLSFWVNLHDYLDTGLFLDHRVLRARVRDEAKGKRVLNLFAYTGSFGVYALAGGAERVVQVDLSKTYAEWAKRNIALNRLEGAHKFLAMSTDAYLEEAAEHRRKFDIVVVDPPTFSTSKKMRGTFDIKRDHGELLQRVSRVLDANGVVYFSSNARGFSLKESGGFKVEPIETVPEDFAKRHAHRTFRLTGSFE